MHKILIANRGEIAVRVARTARSLGYRTVAVYSEADADALHVHQADEAVCIGPAPVGESYLCADRILAAAGKTRADAIHPGYGFLSENAEFARACTGAGLIFIGPGADAIELMASKRLSKLAMMEAGVPVIPGYQGADQSDATLQEQARQIGFPLMVKASAGGGGRGMRLVEEPAELAAQIATARSEANTAFGSDELILEKAVLQPRHIEIQVFADGQGNVVHLGERDCSIQRRHQKVVEEAPSPFVDQQLRDRMGEAAVAAARACAYSGAGTVEFLVDAERNFYFLEMNTRLQVEHPVTEMVTGLDLVAWQLQVAAGQPLPLSQHEISLRGHAVEVRLYAEDPRLDFMPQTGVVARWQYPERDGIRVDHGIRTGQAVSVHYDPMLAKVIAHGESRDLALRRAASALADITLLGVNHNQHFLQTVLRHEVFAAGQATTAFIEEQLPALSAAAPGEPGIATLARAALLCSEARAQAGEAWRSAAARRAYFRFACGGESYPVELERTGHRFRVSSGDQSVELELLALQAGECVVLEDGVRQRCHFAFRDPLLYLDHGAGHFALEDVTHQPARGAGGSGSGELLAAMDGAVVQVLVAQGDTVDRGQTLVVLEAMKMEHQLKAGIAGVVQDIQVEAGQQVKSRQLLVTVLGAGDD